MKICCNKDTCNNLSFLDCYQENVRKEKEKSSGMVGVRMENKGGGAKMMIARTQGYRHVLKTLMYINCSNIILKVMEKMKRFQRGKYHEQTFVSERRLLVLEYRI